MIPTLLHIPHSSREIPEPYRADYLLTPEQLAAEQLKLTDLYTDQLYQLPGAQRAVFPVSRFLVDAERFSDDSQESMAARGMGVLYTVTTELLPLRPPPTPQTRQQLLDTYYTPHHERLNRWAQESIAQFGKALLIDCHSYPSQPLPYELENTKLYRPPIAIGTDDFHTPLKLKNCIVTAFRDLGYEVGLDEPFKGTLTPGACYRREPCLMAFMIEVRKDLYMNEKTGEKLPSFDKIQHDITTVLLTAQAQVSDMA